MKNDFSHIFKTKIRLSLIFDVCEDRIKSLKFQISSVAYKRRQTLPLEDWACKCFLCCASSCLSQFSYTFSLQNPHSLLLNSLEHPSNILSNRRWVDYKSTQVYSEKPQVKLCPVYDSERHMSNGKYVVRDLDQKINHYSTGFWAKSDRKNLCRIMVLVCSYAKPRKTTTKLKQKIFVNRCSLFLIFFAMFSYIFPLLT